MEESEGFIESSPYEVTPEVAHLGTTHLTHVTYHQSLPIIPLNSPPPHPNTSFLFLGNSIWRLDQSLFGGPNPSLTWQLRRPGPSDRVTERRAESTGLTIHSTYCISSSTNKAEGIILP